eukprot:Sspe_Gene.54958::Locus_30278_Transcript_1_1_Confidence_1.000_Length_765::g.54958::m.54958
MALRGTPQHLLRATRVLYPRVVIDKLQGPHGELPVLKNQGCELDAWLFKVPELRPQAPPEKGFQRTRPIAPGIITQRLTLRLIKELHVRYCPFLLGADESVNGNVQRVIAYLNTADCRNSNPNCNIFVETVNKYQPPEYILHFNSGVTWRMQEWSGAHWDEIIQALQRREYEEAADAVARDEELDSFHWDYFWDRGLMHLPHVATYHMMRPIKTNFKERLRAMRLIK